MANAVTDAVAFLLANVPLPPSAALAAIQARVTEQVKQENAGSLPEDGGTGDAGGSTAD